MELARGKTGSTESATVDPSMNRHTPGVTRLRKRSDSEELARLKRLTGLDWDTVPQSLLAPGPHRAGTPAVDTDTGAECRPEPLSRPARS